VRKKEGVERHRRKRREAHSNTERGKGKEIGLRHRGGEVKVGRKGKKEGPLGRTCFCREGGGEGTVDVGKKGDNSSRL